MAVTEKLHEERSFSDNYLWTKRSRKVTYRHEAKNLELNRRKNLRRLMFSTIFVKKVFCILILVTCFWGFTYTSLPFYRITE
ncbi:hypothetical protein HanXRQr2_Chr13g0585441 [Helianthus annuus]|uniref:Uncharacterized protein n=1 Tax=Helianthus annuus TaxID=4232 RepID=A0A9K3EH84_HELAN|nr:hypothetical protein HanXRQr2_Chr13g0585441 [Helianthus annuus]KAJ0848972.1 hypothetical protein HanPSC8_Chr13g0563611 [Helianthus annuus]